jgi:hypothetical protein
MPDKLNAGLSPPVSTGWRAELSAHGQGSGLAVVGTKAELLDEMASLASSARGCVIPV